MILILHQDIKRNIKQFILFVCSCCILMISIYIIFKIGSHAYHMHEDPLESIQVDNEMPSHVIKGITFTNYLKGQKRIRLQAEEVAIKKKSIGFFRIGGLKQLELKKMSLDYYDYDPAIIKGQSNHEDSTKTHHKQIDNHKNDKDDLLSCILSAEYSLTSGNQKLSGFVAYDFTIRIFHADQTMTLMQGNYLTVGNDQHSFIFKGNAAISYQNNMLISNDIVYNFNQGIIYSKNHYVFLSNNKRNQGDGIKTNLRLQTI